MCSTIEGKPNRTGIVDIWNIKLVDGASYTKDEFPVVACTAIEPPRGVVDWQQASHIHQSELEDGHRNYHCDLYIHCCIDDQKFDQKTNGIWANPRHFFSVVKHFAGVLCLDFSTYADFRKPLLISQLWKMRTLEYALAQRGFNIIPNVRWGGPNSWDMFFDPLPEGQMLSLGTVGSGLRRLENKSLFDRGLRELVKRKHPTHLVVIGSDNYPIFDELKESGIEVVQFDSQTANYFQHREVHHV